MDKYIYEIVDNSDNEQYFSLGYWTDKKLAIEALDSCNNPYDLGSPVESEEVGLFEVREHKEGWGSFYNIVKSVKFIEKYNEKRDEYIWVKQ